MSRTSAGFPPLWRSTPLASTVGSGVLETGTGGVTVGWARTTSSSAKGEGWDSKTTSSSMATSLAGITGSGAFIEIPNKSNSGKAGATCLRQSSKLVPNKEENADVSQDKKKTKPN